MCQKCKQRKSAKTEHVYVPEFFKVQENYEEMGHQELGDTHRILLKIRPQLIG